MSVTSPDASDVPAFFDVVINGQGYVTARAVDPNMPFRVQQQNLSYSPTFVERQNVSNSYGDNAQDFFLTVRQRDWSLGEQQKYFRAAQDGRYWMGQNVDVTVPGQVRLATATTSLAMAAAVRGGARETSAEAIVTAGATNLYRIEIDGTTADLGAHGLGAQPRRFGYANDGDSTYFSATGGVGVRRWNSGSFTTFSTSVADSLCYLNNTLYGWRSVTSDLVRYDSAGALTSLFTWKGASGAAWATVAQNAPALTPLGGKLLISFPYAQEAAELWIYDGNAPSRLEVFPQNFFVSDVDVLYGVAYIGGAYTKVKDASNIYAKPAILFYENGNIGKLWEANDFNATTILATNLIIGPYVGLGVANGRLIFNDETTGSIMAYNPALGGVSTIGTYTPNTGDHVRIISTGLTQALIRDTATAYFLAATTYPSSGYVTSSLIDFDSSLPKQFRGVKVEWDPASDGNGGSVDIAYQVDSLTGSFTTLQTGAVSGTEYTFSSVSGHAVAVRITINKGTSTSGPTLKSCSVRGAPQLTAYPVNEYILDLGGEKTGADPVVLRDGQTPHPLNGEQMRANLAAAITSAAPIQVSDRSGTFTAMLEPANCEFDMTRPGQWYARIRARGV